MKKVNRMKLSFSKEEVFRASLNLRNSGVSMPLLKDEEIQKQFNVGTVKESFGFFGSSSDSNKFYPDINVPEDIQPKPEDFIRVPFRLLSATTVAAGSWRATDFSDEKMLKASVSKLVKKPIYVDHDTDLHNWVGIVESTNWSTKSGDIPGGIDGLMAIDAKTNPKIARGVLIGSVFSNSVTVDFEWVPSHSFKEMYEFNDRVGTMHEDGTMIRRIATKIVDYYESSLVWLGADPYAKMIDEDGNLVNIDESSTYNLAKEEEKNSYEKESKYHIPFAMDKHTLSLSKRKPSNSSESNNSKSQKDESMNKELELALRKILGVDEATELSKEHLESLELKDEKKGSQLETFSKITPINQNGETIELAEVEEDSHVILAKSAFQTLSDEAGKVESLEKDAQVGKELLAAERTEVERLYGLSVENKKEDAIVNLIAKATPEELAAFKKQYTKGATDQFSGQCKSCGSSEFEFRSSEGGDDTDVDEVESSDYDDLMEKFGAPKMNLSK